MKKSWWKLIITDYPNFDPNDADLEHIAELIKQGYHQGQLIQEEEKNKKSCKPQAPSVKPQALLTGDLGDDRMNLERRKYDNNNI